MNTEERTALRMALKGLGFERTGYTDDLDASGAYNETWERPNADPSEVADTIRIEWGKRGPRPLIEVLADMDSQRCPYVSNDPMWTGSAYGKREDGLRCGLNAGHVNQHMLYSSDGERVLPNAGWTLPS